MVVHLNLYVAWCSFGAGALYGALLGLFFRNEDWLGGYGSFRRRLLRLGHIACFGIGLLNIAFVATAAFSEIPARPLAVASIALLIAAISMPLVCMLTAFQTRLHVLFPLPVLAVVTAAVAVLWGL